MDWFEINGTDRYLISKQGMLLNKTTGRISRGSKTTQGYYELRITDSMRKTTYRRLVHLIMADRWLTKPDGDYVVDHINNIKTDNELNNLQYVTRAYNASKGQAMRDASCTKKRVAQYTLEGNLVKIHSSVKEACIALGVNSRSPLISYACKGKCSTNNCNTAYGYVWKSIDDDIVLTP